MPKSRLRLTDLTPVLTPVWHVALTDVPISPTPTEVHSLALPSAGTYLVELQDAFEVATLGASRNAVWTLGVTDFTSLSMTAIQHRSGVPHQVDHTQTTNNHTIGVNGISSNNRVRVISTGIVTVSAAATLTAELTISADTGSFKAGSFLRARKHG